MREKEIRTIHWRKVDTHFDFLAAIIPHTLKATQFITYNVPSRRQNKIVCFKSLSDVDVVRAR